VCTAVCWAGMAGAILVVPLLALVPGTLAALSLRFLSPDERAAAAGGFGFAFVGLSAFVAHLSGRDPMTINAAIWTAGVVAGVAGVAITARGVRPTVSWHLVVLWALFYATLIGFQGLTPVYAGGDWYGDWWEHYSIAQAYLGTEGGHTTIWFGDYNLASRTPLFSLAAAFALSFFGDRFWVYQVACTFASSLVVLPLYLLARSLFGPAAARLCAGFCFFNTWLIHDATFTWMKLVCAYFLLLALVFYIRLRERDEARFLYASALCGALAFMSHQSAGYFLVALLADHWLFRPRTPLSWRQGALAAALVAAVVAPWHLWVSHFYGVVGTVQANPVLSTGQPTLLRVLRGGAQNAVTSLVPVPFIDFLRAGRFTTERILRRLVQLYVGPLTGALTLSVVVGLLCTWRRPSATFVRGFHHLRGPLAALMLGASILLALAIGGPRYAFAWSGPGPFAWAYGILLVALGAWTWRQRPADTSMPYTPHRPVILFAVAGYLGALIAHPGGQIGGIAAAAMGASVLIAMAYAIARVATLPRWGLGLVMAGVVLESAVMWALVANLMSGAPPFDSDINRRLKSDNGLAFLYDAAGGSWVPFAVIALLGQGGGVAWLVRMRTTSTTVTTIDRRD
jgi:4-amino-4-deoxy-L-arabinose transferase-like glycosyltransferase